MKKVIALLIFMITSVCIQANTIDLITFGKSSSENKHNFKNISSKIITGGLRESARILLPVYGDNIEGGNMTFTMKIDPDKQNYLTVRFWGSDIANGNILI